ncbi:MAG TPA: hypothetical protein VEY69_16645, partial [Lautropia sp.]|nr:hypothetical protein [Lautropia sp.]
MLAMLERNLRHLDGTLVMRNHGLHEVPVRIARKVHRHVTVHLVVCGEESRRHGIGWLLLLMTTVPCR